MSIGHVSRAEWLMCGITMMSLLVAVWQARETRLTVSASRDAIEATLRASLLPHRYQSCARLVSMLNELYWRTAAVVINPVSGMPVAGEPSPSIENAVYARQLAVTADEWAVWHNRLSVASNLSMLTDQSLHNATAGEEGRVWTEDFDALFKLVSSDIGSQCDMTFREQS